MHGRDLLVVEAKVPKTLYCKKIRVPGSVLAGRAEWLRTTACRGIGQRKRVDSNKRLVALAAPR